MKSVDSLVVYIGTLGFSLFYAWNISMIFWIAPSFALEQFGLNQLIPPTMFLAGVGVGTLFLGQRIMLIEKPVHLFAATLAATLLCCLPELVSLFNLLERTAAIHYGIFGFFAGFAAVFFFFNWEEVGLRNPVTPSYEYVAVSFCVGAGVFLLLHFLFQGQSDIITLLCVVASASILVLLQYLTKPLDERVSELSDATVDKDIGPEPLSVAALRFFDVSALFAVLAMCCGFGMALMMALDYRAVVYGVGSGLIVSIIVLLAIYLTKRRMTIAWLEVIASLVVTICFIAALAVLTKPFVLGCACVVSATWFVFRCFNGNLLMRKALANGTASARFLAASKRSFNVGLPMGWALACILYAVGPNESMFALCAAGLAILLVTVGFVRYPAIQHSEKRTAKSGEATATRVSVTNIAEYADKCMRVADLYQLSPREGEVLCYLARGRSAKHIADDLMVSEHTAKSHIYRIYQKMNIHTKQDLIDLVDSFE